MARDVSTNAEMQAVINGGGVVTYKGRIIRDVDDLPDDAQILLDYPEYAYTRIDGNSRAILGYEISGTLSDGDTLVRDETDKKWTLEAGGSGGGSPAGTDGDFQIKNGSTFAASEGLSYAIDDGLLLKSISPNSAVSGISSSSPTSNLGGFFDGLPSLFIASVKGTDPFYYTYGWKHSDAPYNWASYINSSEGSLTFETVSETGSDYAGYFRFRPNGTLSLAAFGVPALTWYDTSNYYGMLFERSYDVFAVGYGLDAHAPGTPAITWSPLGVITKVPATAIIDASLANSELHFYLDESADTLKAKWKESGGTVFNRTLATLEANQTFTGAITTSQSLVANTSGDGIALINPTAASSGSQSFSPRLRLTGQGWKTTATAASQSTDWIIENQPSQGSSNPTTNLIISSQINSAGYNYKFILSSATLSNGNDPAFTLSNNSGVGGSANQISLIVGSNTGLFSVANGSGIKKALMPSSMRLTWNSADNISTDANGIGDTIIRKNATANIAFGDTDAASPVPQTVSVQNVVAGTVNGTAGADWTFKGSTGVGQGATGKINFQLAGAAASSATTQNTFATVLQLDAAATNATGVSVTGKAAGSGVTIKAISSGTNENIEISSKGTSGQVVLNMGGSNGSGGLILQANGSNESIYYNGSNGGWFLHPAQSFGFTNTGINQHATNILRVNAGGTSGAGSGLLVGASTATGIVGGLTVATNGAVSSPMIYASGTWITGGTTTTNKPHVLIEPTGTTSTTWNVGGTGLGINAASGFTGNLINAQLNGANRFKITRTGDIEFLGYLDFSNGSYSSYIFYSGSHLLFSTWGSTETFALTGSTDVKVAGITRFGFTSGSITSASDVILRRAAAANLAFGGADHDTTIVGQTLSVQNALTGGTNNVAGADFTIAASQGKGTGAGGSIVFKTAPAGSTGNTVNALATALTINSAGQTVTSGGSAAAPGLIIGSGAQFGFWNNANTTLRVAVGGNDVMEWWGGGQVTIRQGYRLAFASSGIISADAFIRRVGAGNIAHGDADSATPVNQIISTQGSRGGTDTNTAGANLTIQSGLGTGSATPSSLVLQSPAPTTGGTTAQTAATGLTIINGTAKLTSYTVSTLPSASVAGAGAMAFVTDANATMAAGIGTTVAGGGSNKVKCFSDGTNWIIG